MADVRDVIADVDAGRLLRRDRLAEGAAVGQLEATGFQRVSRHDSYLEEEQHRFQIPPTRLPVAVQRLVTAGWRVEAEGRTYRRPGRFDLSVSSGVDWFDSRRAHRLRRRQGHAARAAARDPARRSASSCSATAASACCPRSGWRAMGCWPRSAPPRARACASSRRRSACSTRCWPPSPRVAVDQLFARARDELRTFDRIAPRRHRPAFAASCARTRSWAWAGCRSCAASAWAAAWPTTWASARPSRCWRCWRRAGNRVGARR